MAVALHPDKCREPQAKEAFQVGGWPLLGRCCIQAPAASKFLLGPERHAERHSFVLCAIL
jgi:hypothetical protein